MKRIKLGKREIYCLVNDEDFDYLMQWKWYLSHDGYAYRSVYSPELKRAIHNVRMHRQLLDVPADKQVDHINRDRLDNRRENLRACTAAQNLMNKTAYKRSNSGIKGVSFHKGWWRARLQHRFLGNFKTIEEATLTYNKAAKEKFGEFATLNEVAK